MHISSLRLYNFKNHANVHFEFSSQINCFVGNNGVGKTNILDAIHYLSVGKSFLGNLDQNNISYGEDFFSIEGKINTSEKEDTLLIHQAVESKKNIKKNDKTYSRIADHIGYLPSVIISPYDANLILDGGESRRKFLDSAISQTDYEYLHTLIQYQKTLQQRNALLKSFQKSGFFDWDSLEIYKNPLASFGHEIHRKRRDFMEELIPTLQEYYKTISDGKESVSITYNSDLNESTLEKLLVENLQKDRALTYTSKGIHKDDLSFEINNQSIKKVGSQGQQKSFLVALKLSQMNSIKRITGKTPILLLDDIFDKLDDLRVSQLIELVSKEKFGQIFITDTHKERTETVVNKLNNEVKIIEL